MYCVNWYYRRFEVPSIETVGTQRPKITDNLNLRQHHCENFKSRKQEGLCTLELRIVSVCTTGDYCSNTAVPMLILYRYFVLAQEGTLITKLTAKNLQRSQFFIFFGAFAKLRKANISLVMPHCPSVRPHGTTRLPLDGLSCKLIFDIFFENLSTTFRFH